MLGIDVPRSSGDLLYNTDVPWCKSNPWYMPLLCKACYHGNRDLQLQKLFEAV